MVEVEDESQVSIDRISALPKELLGLILSFLTLKEATATSILCHSWKYLWTITPKLNLEGTLGKVKKYVDMESVLIEERSNYVGWVDHVIAFHKMSNLEEFTVLFDLGSSHTECIDRWLSYALSRKTQRLELNLIDVTGSRSNRDHHLCYSFPYKNGNLPNNFKLLKHLSMHLVNVSGEAVEFFIGNCPLLERVSVSLSPVMSSLEIIRPFPSFKCLEISLCHNLKSIVVRDSNVVNIKYSGRRIHFVLINVPLLTQLWIGGMVIECLRDVATMFSSVLPQLEMLKMDFIHTRMSEKETREFASAVEMNNLKQLVVSHHSHNDRDSLLPIINLIRASPFLERFVLEAPYEPSQHKDLLYGPCTYVETLKGIPKAYFHLKEVEFIGYRGVITHSELIGHFVVNNVSLEKIVVDPRCFKHRLHRPWERISRHKMDREISARAYAKEQLEKSVPSRINLKIL